MEPRKNIINGRELPITEKAADQEKENKNTDQTSHTEPVNNPDDTDLYADATVVNGVNDEGEIEN